MTVGELIELLSAFSPNFGVEVATSDRKDEWYEIAELEATTNGNGARVVAIHTD
jgi:hypothetical protein